MKHLFLLSTVILALNSCKPKPEPNPAQAFDGNYVTITTPPVSFTIKDGKFSIETVTVCYVKGDVNGAVFKGSKGSDTLYALMKLENNTSLFISTEYATPQEAESATILNKYANKV